MRLVLTTADLDRMPRSLRRNLMSWLALRQMEAGSSAEMAGAAAESDAAALGWEQAVALVRNVSFGRRNRPVHDLLEALSAAVIANIPFNADCAVACRPSIAS